MNLTSCLRFLLHPFHFSSAAVAFTCLSSRRGWGDRFGQDFQTCVVRRKTLASFTSVACKIPFTANFDATSILYSTSLTASESHDYIPILTLTRSCQAPALPSSSFRNNAICFLISTHRTRPPSPTKDPTSADRRYVLRCAASCNPSAELTRHQYRPDCEG